MEELAITIVRILKLCIAAVVIGSVTLLAVVVMNWDKSPLHGWRLVKDERPATSPRDCNCKPVADDPPPHPRPLRRRVVHPVEPVVDESQDEQHPDAQLQTYQPMPLRATNANLQGGWARYEQPARVVPYNVIVVEKKHRGFFGTIGHGFAAAGRGIGRGAVKVVTFGQR